MKEKYLNQLFKLIEVNQNKIHLLTKRNQLLLNQFLKFNLILFLYNVVQQKIIVVHMYLFF